MSRIPLDIPLERIVHRRYEEKKYPEMEAIEDAIGLVRRLDYYSLQSLVAGAEQVHHGEDISNPTLAYFLKQEEQPLHYQPLHYKETKASPPVFTAEEEEYHPPIRDTERELLTIEEATEAFMEVQYAAVLHSPGEVNHEERRRLQWWILMFPVEFQLLESAYSLTREVNYAPMG